MEDTHVQLMAAGFGCKVGWLPTKYVGLPICLGKPKKHLWDPVVERHEKRLSTWKGRHLSLGGCVALIKSVLSSISIYFLSCFRCPKSVVIRKLQWDFLWNDHIDKKIFHLVKWDVVCKPIVHDGLGIRSMEHMKKSLFGKWLWRLGNSVQGLWRQIIVDKYKVQREGWYVLNLHC